jgi:hypothetical protein
MGRDLFVSVESWFSGGVVVSFTDEFGVEYRGALLKGKDETPEFKGPFHGLASPLSVLHDHPYSELCKKAWKKQVPAKVLRDWSGTAHLPLTPEDVVCKRNIFSTNLNRRAVVETDFTGDSVEHSWSCFRMGERSAKYQARIKIWDYNDRARTPIKVAMKPRHKAARHLKQKSKTKPKKKVTSKSIGSNTHTNLASPTESSLFTFSPMSSPLGKLHISPSLVARAKSCSIGVTPTPTAGLRSPLPAVCRLDSSESGSSLTGLSSRDSSLSPAHRVMRPFSISLPKIPLSQLLQCGTTNSHPIVIE